MPFAVHCSYMFLAAGGHEAHGEIMTGHVTGRVSAERPAPPATLESGIPCLASAGFEIDRIIHLSAKLLYSAAMFET